MLLFGLLTTSTSASSNVGHMGTAIEEQIKRLTNELVALGCVAVGYALSGLAGARYLGMPD